MPLNPRLFEALRRRFTHVAIANECEPRSVVTAPNWQRGGRHSVVGVQSSGEQYRVSCPFCNDTRRRLYVSYTYLQTESKSFGDNAGLIYCHNEGCHEDPKNRLRFRAWVSAAMLACRALPTSVKPEPKPDHEPKLNLPTGCPTDSLPRWKAVELPAGFTPLQQLPMNHPAIEYLRDVRGFDPVEIGRDYGVGYCGGWGADPFYGGRLIVPIYQNGQLATFQGRYVGDVDWKAARETKYMNAVGLQKARVLYNLDRAKEFSTVVVVEGVTDAWRIGGPAVALLGKHASVIQLDLVAYHWAQAVILLDGDALAVAQTQWSTLRRRFRGGVALATLPPGQDPGGMTDEAVWIVIREAAARAGIPISAPSSS